MEAKAWDLKCAYEDAYRERLMREDPGCEACMQYSPCPCGCGFGWCELIEEMVSHETAKNEAYECFEG